MSDMEFTPDETPRHSGIAVVKPQEKVPDEELPMIVWLRGDEEMVEEFTMDADAAMAFLGIKRSRLTQISGRELRVGRLRVDRYIRPVYRPQDLQAYKAWTRAPISHATSSRVMEEAREKLEHQADELSRILATTLESVEEHFAQTADDMQRQLEALQYEQKNMWQQTTTHLLEQMQASLISARQILEQRHDKVESQLLPMQELAQVITQFHGILGHIHGEIREQTVLQKSERDDRLAERERWQIAFDLLNRGLNTIMAQTADLQEEQGRFANLQQMWWEQKFAEMDDKWAQLPVPAFASAAQPRKPRPRFQPAGRRRQMLQKF